YRAWPARFPFRLPSRAPSHRRDIPRPPITDLPFAPAGGLGGRSRVVQGADSRTGPRAVEETTLGVLPTGKGLFHLGPAYVFFISLLLSGGLPSIAAQEVGAGQGRRR